MPGHGHSKWTLAATFTLCCGMTALAQSHAEPGHVAFYEDCWNIAFTGPAWREQVLRKKAAERFEEVSAQELAIARKNNVQMLVWPDDEMRCMNTVPEKIVVTEADGAVTLSIPLAPSKTAVSNALGVSAVKLEANATLTKERFAAISAGARLWLVTSEGRCGWDVRPSSMLYVIDPDRAKQAEKENQERAKAEREEQARAEAARREERAQTAARERIVKLTEEFCQKPGIVSSTFLLQAAKDQPCLVREALTGREQCIDELAAMPGPSDCPGCSPGEEPARDLRRYLNNPNCN